MRKIALLGAVFMCVGGAQGAAPTMQQQTEGVRTFPYIERSCSWQASSRQHIEQGALHTTPVIVTPLCCGSEVRHIYVPGTMYYRQPELQSSTSIQFVCVPTQLIPDSNASKRKEKP